MLQQEEPQDSSRSLLVAQECRLCFWNQDVIIILMNIVVNDSSSHKHGIVYPSSDFHGNGKWVPGGVCFPYRLWLIFDWLER